MAAELSQDYSDDFDEGAGSRKRVVDMFNARYKVQINPSCACILMM